MDRERQQAFGKLAFAIVAAWGIVLYYAVQLAKEGMSLFANGGEVLGAVLNALIFVFCAYYVVRKVGSIFLWKTAALAFALYVLASTNASPGGRIVTAVIGVLVAVVYIYQIRRRFLADTEAQSGL